jgi:hypothetical protein
MPAKKIANSISFKTPCGGVAHLKRCDAGWEVNKFLPADAGRGSVSTKARNLTPGQIRNIVQEARARGYEVRT